MQALLQLAFAVLLPVLAACVLHILQRDTSFGRKSYVAQQAIIGVVFGLIAIAGTEFGIDTRDAVMNVRDAPPIVAGLLFGGPAGIIAGIMGGVERWFSVLWGRGMFTRVACSVATTCTGFYAAFLRRYQFDERKPSWYMALVIGMVAEVLHLCLIFVTNMGEPDRAFMVVRACTAPMVLGNGISVMLAVIAVTLLCHEPLRSEPQDRAIASSVQAGMLLAMAIALVCTTLFTFVLQSGLETVRTRVVLALNVGDVCEDVHDAPESEVPNLAQNRHVGQSGSILIFNAQGYVVSAREDVVGNTMESTGLAPTIRGAIEGKLFRGTFLGTPVVGMMQTSGDYLVVAIEPVSEANMTRNVGVLVGAYMEAIVFALLFVLVYELIRRQVVNNVARVNDELIHITQGNLDTVVDVRENREFTLLSNGINSTVDALKDSIAQTAARIDAELEYARVIQRGALPQVFPPFPSHEEFEIFASMDAAREVGGDFYDFYLLDEDHMAIVMADVSGKGIPAALFMMTAKTLLKSLAESGLPVEEVLTYANDRLCAGNEAEMFVTCWMGILDLATGDMTYANAGHNPPALFKGMDFTLVLVRPNFVLAGMEGIAYRAHALRLSPGDVLFLYTDGVTEATNVDDELYGEDRLLATLNAHADDAVEEMCHSVRRDVEQFVGEAPQFDDMTMLALRYLGRSDHGA